MKTFRGLTWDHPRGFNALDAASRELVPVDADWRIRWDKQSLGGFESRPIEEIADEYDVVVMDHPHLGQAIDMGCLRPWDDLLPGASLDAISRASVGPSYDSYILDGSLWALPLDAATQVCVSRPDIVETVPDTWDDVLRLARGRPVALCLAGPHAALHFFSLCVGLGEAPAASSSGCLVSASTGIPALELLGELHGLSVNGDEMLNPIELLERMGSTNEIACCPLVFGYVNYSKVRPPRHAVNFTNAPRVSRAGRRGSTLGGTGLALSSKRPVDERLLAHLSGLMSPRCQKDFIPYYDGQPSGRNAWLDEGVNAASRNFYASTLDTMEAAWVRPRYAGFVPFMFAAAEVIRSGLEARTSPRMVLEKIDVLFRKSRIPD